MSANLNKEEENITITEMYKKAHAKMQEFVKVVKYAISQNRAKFRYKGYEFRIVHQHHNEYSVFCNGESIMRIIGNPNSFRVLEV